MDPNSNLRKSHDPGPSGIHRPGAQSQIQTALKPEALSKTRSRPLDKNLPEARTTPHRKSPKTLSNCIANPQHHLPDQHLGVSTQLTHPAGRVGRVPALGFLGTQGDRTQSQTTCQLCRAGKGSRILSMLGMRIGLYGASKSGLLDSECSFLRQRAGSRKEVPS